MIFVTLGNTNSKSHKKILIDPNSLAVYDLAASVRRLQDPGAVGYQGAAQGRDGQALRRRPHAQDEAAEAPGRGQGQDEGRGQSQGAQEGLRLAAQTHLVMPILTIYRIIGNR